MRTIFVSSILATLFAAVSYGATINIATFMDDPTFDNITYSSGYSSQSLGLFSGTPFNGWVDRKDDKKTAYYQEAGGYTINTAYITSAAGKTTGTADSGNSYVGVYLNNYSSSNGGFVLSDYITLEPGNTYEVPFKVRAENGIVAMQNFQISFRSSSSTYLGTTTYTLGTDYINSTEWQPLTYSIPVTEKFVGRFCILCNRQNTPALSALAFDTFSSVPEPMTMGLMLLGCFAGMNRRK